LERLEWVFSEAGKKPKAETCEAIRGLIEEADKMVGDIEEEKKADQKLTQLAETMINNEALRTAPAHQR